MANYYSFPTQPASESCPAVPHSVRVWGESLNDATQKLAKALKDDPSLSKEHDFENPDEPSKSRKSTSSKKAQ